MWIDSTFQCSEFMFLTQISFMFMFFTSMLLTSILNNLVYYSLNSSHMCIEIVYTSDQQNVEIEIVYTSDQK